MSDKKQTALQWFIEQIELKGDMRETPSISNVQLNFDTLNYIDLKRQALQMEREQIIDAYYEGKEYGFKEQGEQYYNETYGGQDE
jgi:hypothetical protein